VHDGQREGGVRASSNYENLIGRLLPSCAHQS
jgi:hypothetical protein